MSRYSAFLGMDQQRGRDDHPGSLVQFASFVILEMRPNSLVHALHFLVGSS